MNARRLQLRGQPRHWIITHVPEKLFDFSGKDMREHDPHRIPFSPSKKLARRRRTIKTMLGAALRFCQIMGTAGAN